MQLNRQKTDILPVAVNILNVDGITLVTKLIETMLSHFMEILRCTKIKGRESFDIYCTKNKGAIVKSAKAKEN